MIKIRRLSQRLQSILLILFFITSVKGCDIGCKSCTVNPQTGFSTCLECEQYYLLDESQNICVYQLCSKYTYLEADEQSNQSCVAVCNQNHLPSTSQNICSQSFQCSTQYVQPSQINKGRSIKSIYASNITDQVFLVYDQFINAININSGSFMRSYHFDSSIFLVYQFGSSIFLFGNQKNSVFLWNTSENILTKVLEVGLGTLKIGLQFKCHYQVKIAHLQAQFNKINL
ncbi:hypothetical protein ABPG72_012917 [Tetrahymena utriculariae]